MTDIPPTDPAEPSGPADPPRRGTWRDRYDAARARGVALDPTSEPVRGIDPYPTQYARTHLLITDGVRVSELMGLIDSVAAELGWQADLQTLDGRDADLDEAADRARRGRDGFDLPTIYRVVITPRFDGGERAMPVPPVDAWRLLQRLRVRGGGPDGLEGVSLEHVVDVDPIFGKTNPFDGGGVQTIFGKTNSHGMANAPGMESYAWSGSGGRQVVAYAGAAPAAPPAPAHDGRRPVVAVLDTGCGEHEWFAGVLRTSPKVDGVVIGLSDPDTDPERHPDQAGPMDGELDAAAGHGTFVCGVVRQTGPDADLVAIRVADGSGTVLEGDFLLAIRSLVKWMELGHAVDVMNLSLGYYHETPDAERFDRTLVELLLRMRRLGCAVVCSAGNDATDRPSFPAALWGWEGADYVVEDPEDAAPHISVGALNPNGTAALFSNIGPWVRLWAPGAAVVSTLPRFRGGVQAGSWDDREDLPRETIDPDDYSGGFAIWSGTSFAAPYVAGLLAQRLSPLVRAGTTTAAQRIAALQDAVPHVRSTLLRHGPNRPRRRRS